MKIDFSAFGVGNILRKISSGMLRADSKVAAAKNDVVSRATPPMGEFLFPPEIQFLREQPAYDYYTSCRESAKMYYSDGRVQAAVNKLAFKATQNNENGFPFSINLTVDSKREKERLEAEITKNFLMPGVNIFRRLPIIAKNIAVEGQVFYRVSVDTVSSNITEIRKIKGPRSGFVILGPITHDDQKLDGGFVQIEKQSGKLVNFFFGWEVLRFYWNVDDEMEVGVPLTISAKKFFERTNESEKFVTIARRSRSWMRLIYELQGIDTPEKLNEWIAAYERIRRAKGSNEPFSDVYATGNVRAVDQTSPALWNIQDIEHHESGLFDALQTPRPLYPGGTKDVPNRSVMDVIYDEWLTSYVSTMEDALAGSPFSEGILSLVELKLNLLGKTTMITPCDLVWPSKSRISADEVEALSKLYDTGQLSNSTYFSRMLSLDWKIEQEKRIEEAKLLAEKEAELLALSGKKAQNNVDEPELDDDGEIAVEQLLSTNGRRRHG